MRGPLVSELFPPGIQGPGVAFKAQDLYKTIPNLKIGNRKDLDAEPTLFLYSELRYCLSVESYRQRLCFTASISFKLNVGSM